MSSKLHQKWNLNLTLRHCGRVSICPFLESGIRWNINDTSTGYNGCAEWGGKHKMVTLFSQAVTTCLWFATLDHLHLLRCESSMVKTIASEIKLLPSTHITCKNLPGGAQSVNCGFIALSCKNYERNKIALAEVRKKAFTLWLLSAGVNLPTFCWNLQKITVYKEWIK